ncbi:MAG: ATP-dependent helicase, partial [Ketobacter sp.]
RIEVGRRSGIKPRDIVGAIANEAGIESTFIGDIILRDEFSTVDLPSGMPKELFNQMKKIRVRGTPIRITRYGKETPDMAPPSKRKPSAKGKPGGKPSGDRGPSGKKPAGGKKKFGDSKKFGDKSGFKSKKTKRS